MIEVQLMVFFGIPPLTYWRDDSREWLFPPLFFSFFSNFLCYISLLVIMCEDNASILMSDIMTLPIWGGWVMYAEEELNELAIVHH